MSAGVTSGSSSASARKIGYVTDLEGNIEYWETHIRQSKVIHRDSVTKKLMLHDNCEFVFGGDVCDRGPGDLRILADLVQLKEDNVDRVHFILGNRDINKLRLVFSLHPTVLAQPPHTWWVPAERDQHEKVESGNRTSKLQWVLGQTMGSPYSFEYRRQELFEMGQPHDNEAVTQSYLDLVGPEGLLTKYIKYAKIAVIVGSTMFLHGGLRSHNFGKVPRRMPPWQSSSEIVLQMQTALDSQNTTIAAAAAESVESSESGSSGSRVEALEMQHFDHFPSAVEWCSAINDFAAADVEDYIRKTPAYLSFLDEVGTGGGAPALPEGIRSELLWEDSKLGYMHPQPGSRLAQYGMGSLPGSKAPNPSVVYASYLDAGKPVPCPEDVRHWLGADGITSLVVGHQPNGDAPLVIRSPGSSSAAPSVDILCVDSAYSRNVLWEQDISMSSESGTATVSPAEAGAGTEKKWLSHEAYLAAIGAPVAAPVTASSGSNDVVSMPFPFVPSHAQTRSPLCSCELVVHVLAAAPPRVQTVSKCDAERSATRSPEKDIKLAVDEDAGEPTAADGPYVYGVKDVKALSRNHSGAESQQPTAVDGTILEPQHPQHPQQHPPQFIEVTGTLSNGHSYSYVLSENPVVGKQTTDGWFVKAVGVTVQQPLSTETAEATAAAAGAEPRETFCLLSQSAGYDFKNKLVPETEVEASLKFL